VAKVRSSLHTGQYAGTMLSHFT